jgi:hypothetical protein
MHEEVVKNLSTPAPNLLDWGLYLGGQLLYQIRSILCPRDLMYFYGYP